MTFSDLNIDQDMVDALAAKGIIEPFPIQSQTIPLGLSGQDIIGQAKTGTGKTFGFGLPIIQRLGPDPEPGVKVLVVVPTRELCVQVAEDLELATSNRPTKVTAIYGGKAYEGQIEELKAGAQIVVGTPGACSTSPASGCSRSRTSARWCSTRPTRCSTWASCRMSRSSSRRRPRPGTPCCSRPRCPARSSPSPAAS
ncbi:hypothetical protein GCM10025881_31380 [Pseudolysinimonas kribbensis]|uniref:DEAD/DEAH box helicase n=1 Tax=Pseudolysinimonas kribbensis TaxID=433641 RepID=A0ABQ6K7E2_9MICO|nr:hypothetical protein GCM10025881_31380 [Pseudolysinimonas kribbensis]